jgi:hypothetical protein
MLHAPATLKHTANFAGAMGRTGRKRKSARE